MRLFEIMKNSYFLSQPHQPFFLLGIVNGVVSMVIFVLIYKGVLHASVDVRFIHFYSLAFLVFLNVFTGFLFTTFPRFNQTYPIEKTYYSRVFYLDVFVSILFFGAIFSTKSLLFPVFFLALLVHGSIFYKLYNIYKTSTFPDKTDSYWILTGIGMGVIAHLAMIVSLVFKPLFPFGITVGVFLYLLFSAFAVGQRMIPFFSHSFAQKNSRFVPLVFGLFVAEAVAFAFEITLLRIAVEFVLGIVLAKEFLRWELHPFQSPAILWVLHLALAWLPLGFFISALAQIYTLFSGTSVYFLGIHLLLLGFLLTVLVGFGTRVILGHSGQVPHADRYTIFLFWTTQAIVVARVAVSADVMFGFGAVWLFDIAATLWIALFLLWGGRFVKTLVVGSKR